VLEHLAGHHEVVRWVRQVRVKERVEDVANEATGTGQGGKKRLGATAVVEAAGAGPNVLHGGAQQSPEKSSVAGISGVVAMESIAPRFILWRRVIRRVHGEKTAAEALAEASPERERSVAQGGGAAERTGILSAEAIGLGPLLRETGRLEPGELLCRFARGTHLYLRSPRWADRSGESTSTAVELVPMDPSVWRCSDLPSSRATTPIESATYQRWIPSSW
jgi:hypothetical protein